VFLIVFVSHAVSADFLWLSVFRSLFAKTIEVGDEGDVTVECFIVFLAVSHEINVVSAFLLSFVEDDNWDEFWLKKLVFKQSKSVTETVADLDDVFFIARKFNVAYIDFSWEWCLVDFDVANYACLFVKFEFVHTCTVCIVKLTTYFDQVFSQKAGIDDAVIVFVLDVDRCFFVIDECWQRDVASVGLRIVLEHLKTSK